MSNPTQGKQFANNVAKAYQQAANNPIPRMSESEQIVAAVTQQRRDKGQMATLAAYTKVTESKAVNGPKE